MLKTVATKIAHNSTIPALAGNSDLRPLQDLITAEKNVVVSLQRLSADFARASEALRTWGLGEGDDLGDTLSASANVLSHFSSSLSQYASHGHRMRDQLKAVRTREEALDDLKRRRKSVMSNADAADKKLSKMSPEHKNLAQQQDTLNRLRNEIRSLDADILSEEASLGDFKRSQTKIMMGLKFGGLLECCEKGIITAEYGKLVISEIPEETTPPGVPRSIYQGHAHTEQLVGEAHRRVSEVVLSTTAPLSFPKPDYLSEKYDAPQPDGSPWAQSDVPASTSSSRFLPTPQGIGNSQFFDPTSPSLTYKNPPTISQPAESRDNIKRRSIDDFGTASVWTTADTSGSRFNTYPPRFGSASDVGDNRPMIAHSRYESGPSFSASVDEAFSTIGGRRTDDLPDPPSYVAQEEPLDSDYRQPATQGAGSGRHSAYLDDPTQLAYLAGNDDHDDPYRNQTRDVSPTALSQYGRQGNHDGQRVSQSQSAPTGSSRATPTGQGRYPSQQQLHPNVGRTEEEERALDAAAAREIGREMEALGVDGRRSDSNVTDESKPNSSTIAIDGQHMIQREPSPLLPPAPPFARRSISPRPSFDRFPASSSMPSLGQNTQSQVHPGRQAYEQSSPEIPSLTTRLHSPSNPPSPRVHAVPSISASTWIPTEQIAAPTKLPTATPSPLTTGARTISAAAFKRAIPRKESIETASGDGRLQSPMISGPPLGRSNSDSRPLPTVPQENAYGNVGNGVDARMQDYYNSGRFVTNLEDE